MMLTLCRDNTFRSSTTHKKVLIQSILADVATGSTSQIAAKQRNTNLICAIIMIIDRIEKWIGLYKIITDSPHFFAARPYSNK